MPEVKYPRHGSLAFYPRKRARRIYPSLSVYPPGDKVGMLHAMTVDNRKGSPSFGQEISVPVTVLDCPPLKVLGIRSYRFTTKGLKVLTESWGKNLPKDLARKIKVVSKGSLEKLDKSLNDTFDVRLIVSTQ